MNGRRCRVSRCLPGMVLLPLLFLGMEGSSPPKAQAGADAAVKQERCDADGFVRDAWAYMEANRELERATGLLEEALRCEAGALSYDVHFLLALCRMKQGAIPDARGHARQAWKVGRDDLERERARGLERLLSEQFHQVTFVQSDGTPGPVDLRLIEATPGSFPDAGVVRPVAPQGLEAWFADLFPRVFEVARVNSETRLEVPLQVWLPRGRYTLNSGQTLVIEETDLVFADKRERRRGIATTVGVGMMTFLPWDPEAVAVAWHGIGGVEISSTFRIGSRLHLGVDAGLYLLGLVKACDGETTGESPCTALERTAVGGWSQGGVPYNVALGVSLLHAWTVTDHLTLFAGLSLQGLDVVYGVAQSGDYHLSDPWLGLLVAPEGRLHRRIRVGSRIDGDLSLGVSAGGGMGGLLRGRTPPPVVVPGPDGPVEKTATPFGFEPFSSVRGDLGFSLSF